MIVSEMNCGATGDIPGGSKELPWLQSAALIRVDHFHRLGRPSSASVRERTRRKSEISSSTVLFVACFPVLNDPLNT
jgi:hypothetical protein